MKKLLVFAFFVCAFVPAISHAAWYDNAWDFRIELSSQSSEVAASETDIPLYVDLSLLPSSFFSNVQPDGSDIIVTSTDEVTPLSFELVSFDITAETGEIHFNADSISGSSDTSFYLYYGNDGTNAFIPSNIWADYRGVWHFQEDPFGSTGSEENLGVATLAAMDGGDGGWAMWYGANPIGSTLDLVVDEDQITDIERGHTSEQISHWIFESGLTDIFDSMGAIIGETGKVSTSGSASSLVSYENTYIDPVVVLTSQYESGVPAVARIDNLDTDGFDVFMQNPSPSLDPGTPDDTDVYYLVIEAGSYLLPGNFPLEAGSTNVTDVNYNGQWGSTQMVQLTPSQSFARPVVLGSVQTNNNSQWQSFWSSNGTQTGPATAAALYVGRHTGAETSPTIVDETLGYIIVEQHDDTNGGFQSRAQLGADSVAGVDDAPPYSYPGIVGAGGATDLFTDSTVNGFDADYTGGVASETLAQIGRAVDLKGSSSRLPIKGLNYTNNNNLDEFTASMWLKTTDTARSGIFDFDRSEYWEIGLNFHNESGGAGKISFDTASSSDGIKDLNSSTLINDGDWHHVVVVFDEADPTDKKIYIDGQLDASANQHNASVGKGTTRFGFFGDGSEAGTEGVGVNNLPYEGLIDESRIQHRAVDASWIETTYNNQADNASFWSISSPEQDNSVPEAPTNLFFDNTSAQTGETNPANVEVGGVNSLVPYFSSIYQGDGDTADRAYIQVSTDSSFAIIDYWDSDWFDLDASVDDGDRSEDVEYGDTGLTGASAALLPLAMDDGDITYYWRMAFEDETGLQGGFSAPSTFSLLDTPSTPGNVSVTKVEGTPDTFIVNWQDTSISETSFEVEYQENTGAGFGAWQSVTLPTASPTPADTTSWGMENTVDNASYNFRVRSCNYSACSTYLQDPMTHFTDPAAPVNVCSAYVSDTQFNVSWKNRAVFDESTVEQCDNGDCLTPSFTSVATSQAEPGPVAASTATNGAYRWSVFADNGIVTSSPTYSNFEYSAPAAPTSVQAVRVSDSIIDLTWTDASAYEDGFRVSVSIDGGAYTELTPGTNTVAANGTMYTYTDAQAGSEYQFEVKGHIGQTVCDVTTNTELLSVAGTSNTVVTTQEAPLVNTVSYTADNDVSVFWLDQSDNEDGFNVYVREDDGAWTLDGSVAANVATYNYTSGSADHVYDFYIESFTNVALPGNPDALTNTRGPAEFRRIYSSPAAPDLAINAVSSTSVDWSLTDNASYELGFSLYDSDTLNLIQSIASPNVAAFTETNFAPNNTYNRLVRSYVENAGSRLESADSTIINLVTLANSPAELVLEETEVGTVELTWTDGDNPAGTEFSVENTTTGQISGWVADLLSFTETDLLCGTLYEYALKSRNSNLVETGELLEEIQLADCVSQKSGTKRRSDTFIDGLFNLLSGNDDDEEENLVEKEEYTEPEIIQCSINYYRLIKRGLRGEDVRQVQTCMNSLGYTSGPEDGIYGPLTYDGITAYQTDKGLQYVDGIVGPETSGSLNSLDGVSIN